MTWNCCCEKFQCLVIRPENLPTSGKIIVRFSGVRKNGLSAVPIIGKGRRGGAAQSGVMRVLFLLGGQQLVENLDNELLPLARQLLDLFGLFPDLRLRSRLVAGRAIEPE